MISRRNARRAQLSTRGVVALAACAVTVALGTVESSAHRVFPEVDPATGQVTRNGAYSFGVYHPDYRQVDFWFDDGFPGEPCSPCPPNSKKQAVLRATNHWNKLGQDLRFVGHPEEEVAVSSWEGYCEDDDRDGNDNVWLNSGDPMGVIFWDRIPTGSNPEFLAVTKNCRRLFPGQSQPQFWSFKQLYNENPNNRWYSGRGRDVPERKPPPNTFAPQAEGFVDLQSVATHEFGHSTGWYPHYDLEDGQLAGNQRCGQNEPDRWTMCRRADGESWGRTLEKHDKHTFGNAYPP